MIYQKPQLRLRKCILQYPNEQLVPYPHLLHPDKREKQRLRLRLSKKHAHRIMRIRVEKANESSGEEQ